MHFLKLTQRTLHSMALLRYVNIHFTFTLRHHSHEPVQVIDDLYFSYIVLHFFLHFLSLKKDLAKYMQHITLLHRPCYHTFPQKSCLSSYYFKSFIQTLFKSLHTSPGLLNSTLMCGICYH